MKSYSPKKSTDSLVGKYRKNVRGDTPAAAAISSVLVSSKPFSAKSSSAASMSALRVRAACSCRGERVAAITSPLSVGAAGQDLVDHDRRSSSWARSPLDGGAAGAPTTPRHP